MGGGGYSNGSGYMNDQFLWHPEWTDNVTVSRALYNDKGHILPESHFGYFSYLSENPEEDILY